ncbi:hypothetical protein REPUB_Repub09cG0180100 [Reevesia pubescens]
MLKGTLLFPFSLFTVSCILASTFLISVEASCHGNGSAVGHLVQKRDRKPLIVTEYGEISAVKVSDGIKGPFHLQFITLEPNSLFLPVLLHADMVFYVHTGSGILSWTDDNQIRKMNIQKGDIYRLHPGSVFYVQSSLEPEIEKLRIHAIFSSTEDNIYEPSIGAYSSITDVVLGFDSKVLQAAFKVPEDVIEEIMKATKPPAIIHAVSKKKKTFCEWQARLLKAFLGSDRNGFDSINGKKKKKAYNVLEADPDFKNCNGWSLTVDRNDLRLLRDSQIGVFMVNLTKGSMMAPHWNPRASEIAIVLQGQGMVRVACSSNANKSECKNMRFRVKEGDVFAIPRFYPMAQMSFNNDSFVFMGFSTSTKRNHPQFLAGKSSVLGILDRHILAVSFNVKNTTIDQLLTPQKESFILDCTSCAEEEERLMEEEFEREREEEEEARKKEEEEAQKREKEEEEARKRKEEEETKKREEEEARKRKEEEEAKKREEEEARKRKEEEAKKREEEEARKRKEEEEAKKREEEEAKKRKEKEEEEEEAKKREEEEEKRREEEARKEQEEARRQEEERQRRARQEEEEEEERKRQEEKEKQEEIKKKEKEEEGEPERRKEEKGQPEGRRKREEAAAKEQEEAKRQEQERQRRAEQEEEEARREREKQRNGNGVKPTQQRVLKKKWEI